ncbi:hypothetical protein HK098_004932, partial [Nowakowskiella sp. JEL0407]
MVNKSFIIAAIAALATSAAAQCASANGQCGGQVYTGPTCCPSGYTCKYVSTWYSQ